VIEAWSACRPVVAVAAAGPRELIRDGGDGRIAAMENPEALGAAIAATLADPGGARMLARAGRTRFEREFSVAPVLERWRDFFARIASGGAG
jgi:glycosyltransferase involved in cell wall biosynthesis